MIKRALARRTDPPSPEGWRWRMGELFTLDGWLLVIWNARATSGSAGRHASDGSNGQVPEGTIRWERALLAAAGWCSAVLAPAQF
jgi:hypothetical protein